MAPYLISTVDVASFNTVFWWKAWFCAWLLLIPYQWGQGGFPHYCQMGVEVQASRVVFIDSMGKGAHYLLVRMKVLIPYFTCSYTTPVGVFSWFIESQRWMSRFVPHLTIAGVGSVSFSCDEQLLSNSFLSTYYALFLVLCLEREAFHWDFFFGLCLVVLLGCWILPYQEWDILGKKKVQGAHCHVVSWVLWSLVNLPSHHLSEYIYFIFSIHSFCLYLVGGIGKSTSFYSILPEMDEV